MTKGNSPKNILRRLHAESSVADPETNQDKLEQIRGDSKKDFFIKVSLIEHLTYFNILRGLNNWEKRLGLSW